MSNASRTAHPFPKYKFRPEKAAEAIEIIARRQPGITQYFVGKFLYLADKLHFLDWGRPITYDRYVAMKHGPVPSAVRNMLAAAAGADAGMDDGRILVARNHASDLVKKVNVRLIVGTNGERQCVYPINNLMDIKHLSKTDIDCLNAVMDDRGADTFGGLREMTHQDEAWREAWVGRANNRVADIDITLWAPLEQRQAIRNQIREYGHSR